MVDVISSEEAEKVGYVICVRSSVPARFDDDLLGSCSRCSHEVRFRPYSPKTPPKLCMECFLEMELGPEGAEMVRLAKQ